MRSAISRFAAVLSASVRQLIAMLTLASSVLPASAADRLTTTDPLGPSPMRFARHTEGPADRCGKACRTWISEELLRMRLTAAESEREIPVIGANAVAFVKPSSP
jgi:hypothetical protein